MTPWDDYARRVMGFEGNPNDPRFYRPQWDVRQWTSGYGTRARPGETIDLPEAERRFGQEFGNARDRVQAFAPDLSTGRQAALSSLTMNAGPGWMNQGLGRAVRAGDWADAQRRFLQYTSSDPRYQRGLANRRQQEAGWLTDVQPAGLPSAPLGATTAARGADLGDPRWGQLPMMGAAREQLPGAIAMGLGAGGVRPADPQMPTRRGPNFVPYTPPPPYAPDDTPMPPLLPRPAPDLGVGDPFGGGPIQLPTPPVSGFGDMTPPGPDYAAPGPAAPPAPPDYAAPQPMPPPDRADPNSALPGIVMTPPDAMPQPSPPTLQQMGVSPAFGTGPGIPGGTLGALAPGTSGQPGPAVATGDTPPQIKPPITDSGPPPSGLPAPGMAPAVDKSLAGMMLGPNIAGGIRGVLNDRAFLKGVSILTGMPSVGAEPQYNAEKEARTATVYGQQQADYGRKLAAFNTAFPQGPAGPPNLDSALLRGLTAPAAAAVGAMGVDQAVDWLGKYQLADAEKRANMQRQMEQIELFKKMAAGQGQGGAPTVAPPAAAPLPPDIGGLGRPSLMPAATGGAPTLPPQAGVGISQAFTPRGPAAAPVGPVAAAPPGGPAGAMPQLPPMGARGPLPLPQTPGVMPPGMPEPMVNVLGTPMPLSQAEAMAQYMKMAGSDTSELQASINAAREPQKRYADTMAQKQAEQEQAKPQQRQAISGTLDSIEMTRALANKIKTDPNLPNVLGFYGKLTPSLSGGAQDVEANMETLLKRQALDTMARLKAQSATGATGFGSTNDKELGIITGALTNLENKFQTPRQYRQNIDTLITSLTNAEGRIKAGWQENYKEPWAHPEGYTPSAYPTERAAPEPGRARRTERTARQLDAPLTNNGRPVLNIGGKYVDKEEYERATAR